MLLPQPQRAAAATEIFEESPLIYTAYVAVAGIDDYWTV